MLPIIILVVCLIIAFLMYELSYVPSGLVKWTIRFAFWVFAIAAMAFIVVSGRLPPLYSLLYVLGPLIVMLSILRIGAKNMPISPTNLAEAYALLDLQPGASKQEVLKAHKRLLMQLHPDKGGSSYLAARLNEARDLILQNLKK